MLLMLSPEIQREKKVQGTLKNVSNEITTTKSRWN